MSRLRIRFRFNQQSKSFSQGVGGTRGAENFSRVIVQDVAFSYSDHLFNKLKRDIEKRMRYDIQRELDNMARMFMYGVVGIQGRNRGPVGNLNTVAPRSDAMRNLPLKGVAVRGLSGNWPRRSEEYLRWRHKNDLKGQAQRKDDRGGDPPWFRRSSPSVLDRLSASSTWTGAYGGISISIHRHKSFAPRDPAARNFETRLGGTRGGTAHVGVATIRVDAMKRITPEMLPALGGGRLGDFGENPRASGLLSMLGRDIAIRLGGNPNTVPFRPTIQPFLGFFLTRALPNAVFRRIEQGLDGRPLNDRTGSAGRVGRNKATGRTLTLKDYMPRR